MALDAQQTRSSPCVGMVGTFDVANYGDVLFPLIAEHELGKRLPEFELRRYGYRPMRAPDWPYDVRPLGDLIGELPELDVLLIGGGHIVRFDRPLAPGYGPGDLLTHDPAGLWLVPTLAAGLHGVPVVWNAPGAWAEPASWAGSMMRAALRSVSYLAVRDQASIDWLTPYSDGVSVSLVPDSAFSVAALVPREPTREYDALRRSIGLDEPYVILQPSPQLHPHRDQVQTILRAAQDRGLRILELPISPALGDAPGILELDAAIDTVAPGSWPPAPVIAELISRAEAVVGQSLHLSITAVASGVPVHRPAAAGGDKTSIVQDLPAVYAWQSDEPTTAPVLGRTSPDAEVQRRLSQLAPHWDMVASVVGRDRRQATRELEYLLTQLPADLDRIARERDASRTAREEMEHELHQTNEHLAHARATVKHLEGALDAERQESATARAATHAFRLRFEGLQQRRGVAFVLATSELWAAVKSLFHRAAHPPQ